MKKILFIILFINTFILANINAVVSILPEKTFVKAIGGDKVNVSLMVLPGNSPHTYEPKPSQMKDVAKANLYFAIGVEFENVWLGKFSSLNKQMKIIDLTEGIKKRAIAAHQHEHTHGTTETKDPHIWTDPENVKIIALHIYESLLALDPENKTYYKVNYHKFIAKIVKTDRQIKKILSHSPKGTKFMVFHPSWGYFAHAYGLVQLSIEIEGKSPKPKEMVALIKEAREEKIKAIFTQPEFSDAMATVLANELKITVIKVSPLAENWSENLLKIAHAIAGK
jgi:zinc transport system substrate-binding protein